MIKTTLNKISAYAPHIESWGKLLTYLGKNAPDDEPLEIPVIIDAIGYNDALLCMQTIEDTNQEMRKFAIWCIRQVQHLILEKDSIGTLEVAMQFAEGNLSKVELKKAHHQAKEYYDRSLSKRLHVHALHKIERWGAASTLAEAVYKATSFKTSDVVQAPELAALASMRMSAGTYSLDAYISEMQKQENELRNICSMNCTNKMKIA